MGWHGYADSNGNLKVRSVLSFSLNETRLKQFKKMAAGDGLEPSTSAVREQRPAAERPGCGWEGANRTPEVSFKD
jgi:hypothetical protein